MPRRKVYHMSRQAESAPASGALQVNQKKGKTNMATKVAKKAPAKKCTKCGAKKAPAKKAPAKKAPAKKAPAKKAPAKKPVAKKK